MWEENQYTGNKVWAAWSPYKSQLREIVNNRMQAKKAAEDESFNHLSAGAMNLDTQAYQTNDENLNKEYRKNSQLASVAYMVKYAAKQNWADWSNLTTVSDIMSNYFNKFPETANQIKEFINSDRNPEEFWIEMWWLKSDDEEEKLNRLERIYRDIKHPMDLIWQWAIDLASYWLRKSWNTWMADTYALDTYAYKKYGKYIEDMTQEEIDRLELDFDLENAKNWTYIMGDWESSYSWISPFQKEIDAQRLDVWLLEWTLWAWLSALELAFPAATLWITAAAETPILWLPIQLITWAWEMLWEIVSLLPWLNGWINSLPEDLQWEVKTLWWVLMLWKAVKSWTMKNWEIRPRLNNIRNNISESELIGNIMDYITKWKDWTSKAKDNLWKTVKEFANSSEYKKLEKERKRDDAKMDAAWRISGAKWNKAIEQTWIIRNELERLWNDVINDLVKKWKITEEDLYDVMNEHSNRYETWEDGIYSRNIKRYKPWESQRTQNKTDVSTWISAKPVKVDPIWEWIKYLKQIYKSDRDMMQTLDIVEKKWKKVWLTRGEANQLARQIAEWARIYKEASRDMFTADYVQEIEQARRDLKAWAREPFKETVPWLYKALEYLDEAWSDNMNSKSMMRNNMENLRSYKNNYPKQEDWQKRWWVIAKTRTSKWKNITDSIFQSRAYNPITRSAWLSENLKDFVKNNKWNPDSYENIIKAWYDETFRDVVNPEWTYYNVWEWEVLYPKKKSWTDGRNYLEDIVEIVDDAKEITAENLITKYGDLTNQLKKLWLSDAEITAANDAIYQWWLFWWEPIQTAKVENWVMKSSKGKKSSKKSESTPK